MDQENDISQNEKFNSTRYLRMVSMLQPLGSFRRIERIDFLLLSSDCIMKQQIFRQNGMNPPISVDVNTSTNEYKELIEARKFLQNRIKEDVIHLERVINYCEKKISPNKLTPTIKTNSYYMSSDQNTLKTPLEVIQKFFQNSLSDGLVIYFSGVITSGAPCMPFQIKNKVYLISVHQIISIWRSYLNSFQHKKQLFLIIESPKSGTFLDGIHRLNDRIEQYNVSFLFSEKENRVDVLGDIVSKYKEKKTKNDAYIQRVNEMDFTPYNFVPIQDDVWKINQYVNCSEFTAVLCEYLLNSPPKRIHQLYETKPDFYFSQFTPQPGFFGFAMKNYLDFGWNFDITYQRIQQQTSINYFGIERQNYNDSMIELSTRQDNIIFKGFSYYGLVRNSITDQLTNKQISKDQTQEQSKIVENQGDQVNELQIKEEEQLLIRHCCGFQIFPNGVKYIGQWLNNKQNGMAVAIYQNGDRYEGQFVNGKQSGYGFFYRNISKDVYAGQFYNNRFYGKGILLYKSYDNRCFMGNFSGQEATGYVQFLNGEKKYGSFSDKKNFQERREGNEHDIVMDIGDEKDEFECGQDTKFYEISYKDNDIKSKCDFDKKVKEYQQKKQEKAEKAKSLVNLLICKGVEINIQNNNNGVSTASQLSKDLPTEVFDFTKTEEYQVFKEDLSDLNPEMDQTEIKTQDVEFLVKHAICKEVLDQEQIEEKQEKTQEVVDKLQDVFDLVEEVNDNKSNNTITDPEEVKKCSLIPLVAMQKFYSNQGIDLFITDEVYEKTQSDQFKDSMLAIGQSSNAQFLQLKIEDTKELNFNMILNENDKKREFIEDFKITAAKAHGCRPEDIIIIGLNKGSIDVEYKFKDGLVKTIKDKAEINKFFLGKYNAEMKIHSLLEHATLTPENCDPRFNAEWSQQKVSWRGGLVFKNLGFVRQHYIFPYGWKGYGLNIKKYSQGDWLGITETNRTWIVLYHGTNLQGLSGISKEGFKSGKNHLYAGTQCRIKGEVIDNDDSSKCVYLADDANIAGEYSTPFEMKGKHYRIVFQCRVNPEVVRSPRQKDCYYIVQERDNPTMNIRPYRILLKKLNAEEVEKYQRIQEDINKNQQIQEMQSQLEKDAAAQKEMEKAFKNQEENLLDIKDLQRIHIPLIDVNNSDTD